jgi:hypothetical protein
MVKIGGSLFLLAAAADSPSLRLELVDPILSGRPMIHRVKIDGTRVHEESPSLLEERLIEGGGGGGLNHELVLELVQQALLLAAWQGANGFEDFVPRAHVVILSWVGAPVPARCRGASRCR